MSGPAPKPGFLARCWRLSRWCLLGLVVLAVPADYGIHYTNEPQFCNSCHIMEPYFSSWHEGSHKNVECVQCHYPPDVEGILKTKLQGLNQVVSYVTDTAATRPSAHVVDGSCMRPGCHMPEDLGPTSRGPVAFDHRPHLNPADPSKRLRCTTCHNQTTVDQHMSLDTQPCFVCHMDGHPTGEPLGGCQGCHAIPDKKIEREGLTFDHQSIALRGIPCGDCHSTVTKGRGEVIDQRCLVCHAEAEKVGALARAQEDPARRESLHHSHVIEHSVDCRACHAEIRHGKLVDPHAHSTPGSCGSCHPDGHDQVSEFMAGKGGAGVDPTPSLMHEVGLSCEACHRRLAAAEEQSESESASEAACLACHKGGARGMVEGWKSTLARESEALAREIGAAEPAVRASGNADAAGRLAEARANVDLVRKAGGIHNIAFARALHRAAADRLDAACEAAGDARRFDRSTLTTIESGGDCRVCHVTAERTRTSFGMTFRHDPHLAKAGLECGTCHDSGSNHGRLTIGPEFCKECHHGEEEVCSSCHEDQAAMMAGSGIPALLDRPDPMDQKVPCIACHSDRQAADQIAPSRAMCIECHDPKYGPMQDDWMREEQELLVQLGTEITAFEVFVGDRADDRAAEPAFRSRLSMTRRYLDQLRRGRLVHNPGRAREIAALIRGELGALREFLARPR